MRRCLALARSALSSGLSLSTVFVFFAVFLPVLTYALVAPVEHILLEGTVQGWPWGYVYRGGAPPTGPGVFPAEPTINLWLIWQNVDLFRPRYLAANIGAVA